MRLFILFVALLAGTLTQALLPEWRLLGNAKPPVLASIVLYYALRSDTREMWKVIILAAVLHDGLDLGRSGFAIIAFPVLGLFAQKVRFEVFPDEWITQMILGAFGGLIYTLIAGIVLSGSGQRPLAPGSHALRLIGSFLAGLITMPLVSRLLMKAEAGLPRRREIRWK
jgi:hypothetical protein